MINSKKLCQFLVTAKKNTYAAGNERLIIREKDRSKTLTYKEGDWQYNDNHFGGEPYGGREVVFFKGNPVYIMVFYGQVSKKISPPRKIYRFLQKALQSIPADKPFRGPKNLKDGHLRYENSYRGTIKDFSGVEKIFLKGKKVYQAFYAGGLVDRR